MTPGLRAAGLQGPVQRRRSGSVPTVPGAGAGLAQPATQRLAARAGWRGVVIAAPAENPREAASWRRRAADGGEGAKRQGTPKSTPRICRKEIRPWSNSGLGKRIPAGFNRDSPSARKPGLQAAGPTPLVVGNPALPGPLLWIHPSAPRRDVLPGPSPTPGCPL